jgi:Flp pilus assembly protein TadD
MADTHSRDEVFDEGNTHLALGELEKAESAYRRAVALDDNFFDGWQALGMSCGIKATLLEPDDLLAWTGLSQMYVRDGQIAEAEHAKGNARILSMGGKVTNLGKS